MAAGFGKALSAEVSMIRTYLVIARSVSDEAIQNL
jgi:hypothetical protein